MPKPKTTDRQGVLKRNPRIKEPQLDDSIALAQQLEASGIKASGYNLASPFSRRRMKKFKGEWGVPLFMADVK
jgi:hypothetical protein